MKPDISKWKEEDEDFVETQNFLAMMNKVRHQPFVTFVGVQGSGKTATARHIALKLKEEGYEILQLREIKDIENYCHQNTPYVFVIDDILGMFELEMSKLEMFHKYESNLTNPEIPITKFIMTCREEVFKNDIVLNTFLSKKENVVLMHSQENALTHTDKYNLCYKYNLGYTEFNIKTQQSKMFPKLCKVLSKREEYMKTHGKYPFLLPIPCILEELDGMNIRNKTYYASLILLMVNKNTLSEEDLPNGNQLKCDEKKAKILRACEVSLKTESSHFISALTEMNGIYTRRINSQFSFLNFTMFKITAYHFGCQFPELILQYMSSDYIADYIKIGTSNIGKMTKGVIIAENVKIEGKKHNDTPDEDEIVDELFVKLQGPYYHLLAARVFKDVLKREEYVFSTEFLKHPVVLQCFFEEMARLSCSELCFVFLSGLNETNEKRIHEYTREDNKHYPIEIMKLLYGGTNAIYYDRKNAKLISFVIYHGHHQILQYIVYQMLKEKNNVNDLFRNFNENCNQGYSNKENDTDSQLHSEVDYNLAGKPVHSLESEDYKMTETETDSDSASELDGESHVREKHRLLRLACYSGDITTVQILLSLLEKETLQITLASLDNIYFECMEIASHIGNIDILMELVKWLGDKKHRFSYVKPLIAACKVGHLNIVLELIKLGADVNLSYDKQFPLISACLNGHLRIVEELIKAGADVNLKLRETNLLMFCRSNGYWDIEVELLKAGAKFAIDVSLYQHFTDMCYKGHSSVVKELIKAGADVNQSDGYQKPLVAASLMGHLNVVEELIKAGASVNQSVGKETPLTAACGSGHLDIVQALIKRGGDVNLKDDKRTPLIAACDKGHLHVLRELVEAGANVNLRGNYKTPLAVACKNGNSHVVIELIKAGANVNRSVGKETPLQVACVAGDLGIVQDLIHAGADVNIKDSKTTPLIAACDMKNWSIVSELIIAGADVNVSDGKKTPLTAACAARHRDELDASIHTRVIKELIKAGANVNLRDIDNTPLTAACDNRYLHVVEELIKAGADVNKGVEKETPLTAACNCGHLGIVNALIKAGVDVNLKSGNKTPIKIAVSRGHVDIAKMLKKAGADP